MVIVIKVNGKVRICIDFRDLNRVILREYFLLKIIEDFIVEIDGVIVFMKFDVILGFWYICLDVDSCKLCIFNIFFGKYSFICFLFGIKLVLEVY